MYRMGQMRIRPARISDAATICEIVNHYAERGKMLHLSLENVYDSLREFTVAENGDGNVTGCVAVDVFWADLAEVRSLAVAPDMLRQGLGQKLLQAAIEDAERLGIRKLFTLTYETEFFEQNGFVATDRVKLPEKVWRVCLACPKVDACDETAMMLEFTGS